MYERNRRRRRALSELAERSLAMARDLHARALMAETSRAACELSEAYCRVAQSIRQTLTLQAKLEADDRLQAREEGAETETDGERRARIYRRRARVDAEAAGAQAQPEAPDPSAAGPAAPKRLH